MIKITKEDRKKLSSLINKKFKLVIEVNDVGSELDSLINKIWGFHYSDYSDGDPLVDALDYGFTGVDDDGFIETMNEIHKKHSKNL